MHEASVKWQDDMAFNVELAGGTVPIDASEKHGGTGRGPLPKDLVLGALGGCTGMDVISILRKMRVVPDSFAVDLAGEIADDHPRVFTSITVTYRFTGADLPEKKLRRAIELSEDRYCPVNAMLRGSVRLTSQIEVNGALLAPVSAAA